MRAAISRKTTVTVKAVTHYASSATCLRKCDGAYAVTELVVYLNKPEYTENVVCDIFEKAAKETKRFYNLKKLHVHTPYALWDGEMLQQLLSMDSTYTHLELDVFAFHLPKSGVWQDANVPIKHLEVSFNDGVAYPNAGTELFAGIENNDTIQEVKIWNKSPHVPKIRMSLKMRKQMGYTSGVNIRYY